MDQGAADLEGLLGGQHPYDALDPETRAAVAGQMRAVSVSAGEQLYAKGAALEGLYLIADGRIEVRDENDTVVSVLGPRNSFGERGLLRDGRAVTSARADVDSRLFVLPAASFHQLVTDEPAFKRFFDRSRPAAVRAPDLAVMSIADLMVADPATIAPDATVRDAARRMRELRVSCLLAVETVDGAPRLTGILTRTDLANRALAEGLPGDAPVRAVMTPDPVALSPQALGSDVLHEMLERRIGHLPVVENGALVGVVTQSDLMRRQSISAGRLIDEVVKCGDADALAEIVGQIPELLVQLVGAGARHDAVTRLITDIGDAVTRRLLFLAEHQFGPPPVRYLWLACGSQGRQEQTGVSDQDNCLFLDDALTPDDAPYFEQLARFVSDGLDRCGYFYCPGDMMATNPRWRQPLSVWRDYFDGWIRKPDPMAQMLASVMFDLRPIGGDESLFHDLQEETLERASKNSIFVAHMIANSLGHQPPLGLFRGVATIRSGEHKNTIDLKHNGVAPVVDLGRVYALMGRLSAVNTRARVSAAREAGVVSQSGGRDLLDAYDVIAEMRLTHQMTRVRDGLKPDNFMPPATLSDLERSHLRDAFVVVTTMQSAIGQGRSAAF